MKRFLLLVAVIATCFAIPASAQIKFGVKGGLNITDMSFSKDVVNTSNKTGFFIGPTVKFKIPVIGIGFDVAALYDQREAKTK
ncbi:MAG: outer membrane beta-barrel protein, partial [Prevotella sp.]|nr:outer membrane beta-barrel protein [Prevotella sp.]